LGFSQTYSDFIHRDNKYYDSLANACNSLLTSSTIKENLKNIKKNYNGDWVLNGNEFFLPDFIKSLHASEIVVENDHIGITMVPGRGGWIIAWEHRNLGEVYNCWILSANTEGQHLDIYSIDAKSLNNNAAQFFSK
jgi:hypothetical protein